MISQCEVICNALQIIEKEGWIQHQVHSSNGYCLSGACDEAVMRTKLPTKDQALLKEIVTAQVTAALPEQWRAVGQGIISFNDAKGRKKYEIQTVLKTAGACNHDH